VAFTKKETGEVRQLSAGDTLTFYLAKQHQGVIKTTSSLYFDNRPLSEVITALQKQYGKKILLKDTALAQKALTAHLDGESFDDALKTICVSLDLDCLADSGTYLLKSRSASNKIK
jgi:ferric-dicitrate binding protein FerR (iron transport regulator)